jgi:sugar (pentulose or hexulose) kinase
VEEGCKACIHGGTRIDPNANAHAEYDQFYGIYRSIYPQLKNIFAELKEI